MSFLKQLFNRNKTVTVVADPVPAWIKDLQPGDIVIECGANVGKITRLLADTGATVYAFEPNPQLFNTLQAAFRNDENVVCLRKAVGDDHCLMPLPQASVYGLTGSSTEPLEVECLDLCAFIVSLGETVKVLRLDVNGDSAILQKMIKTGLIHRIGKIVCTLNDAKTNALHEQADMIRRHVRDNYLTHVDLGGV